jgi:hypothetical protein
MCIDTMILNDFYGSKVEVMAGFLLLMVRISGGMALKVTVGLQVL